MTILVTGAAGFIGFHTAKKYLENNVDVIGIDNLNDYYDVNLKLVRLELLKAYPNFTFYQDDICHYENLNHIFQKHAIDNIIHLAAQAGVRYSIENPHTYIQANVVGFTNILELCRHHHMKHLVYASTSSIYGLNSKQPYSEHDAVDHPVSVYAATKKANEALAHSYAHLFKIPCTGLRFFTVYGPWGRPDMAPFLFTDAIAKNQPINIYNHGDMLRDFTFIDDIVTSIIKIAAIPATPNPIWNSENPDPASSQAPYRIYNIGNSNPIKLLDFVNAIEMALDKKAKKIFLDMQPGDMQETFADVSELTKTIAFKPQTKLQDGINKFVEWYRSFYPENTH